MLWIPHQLVGVPLAYNVTLECFTEAHPTSLNYWTREDGHMIHDSQTFRSENTVGAPSYKTHMKLTITNIKVSEGVFFFFLYLYKSEYNPIMYSVLHNVAVLF